MIELRIGVQLASTIQVRSGPQGDFDFLKPSVWAELKFDELPTEAELKAKWNWL